MLMYRFTPNPSMARVKKKVILAKPNIVSGADSTSDMLEEVPAGSD